VYKAKEKHIEDINAEHRWKAKEKDAAADSE
jgi:hypothetical protein